MPAGDALKYDNVHKYMASIGERMFGTDVKTHLERTLKGAMSERGREKEAAFAITDKLFVSCGCGHNIFCNTRDAVMMRPSTGPTHFFRCNQRSSAECASSGASDR